MAKFKSTINEPLKSLYISQISKDKDNKENLFTTSNQFKSIENTIEVGGQLLAKSNIANIPVSTSQTMIGAKNGQNFTSLTMQANNPFLGYNSTLAGGNSINPGLTSLYPVLTNQTIKSAKSAYHLESDELMRLKQQKIDFFGLIVPNINEADEKFLFDLTVQLKYGDQKVIKKLIIEELATIIADYPLEVLLSQGELINELLVIYRKIDGETQYHLLKLYNKILKKIVKTYEIYADFTLKNYNQAMENLDFIISDDKYHIKHSYPTLDKKRLPSNISTTAGIVTSANNDSFVQRSTNIKTTGGTINMFSMFDNILRNSLEFAGIYSFNDQVLALWKQGINILNKFKFTAYDLVTEQTKDLLRLFSKILDELGVNGYEDPENLYVYHIALMLFRVFSAEEYQNMTKSPAKLMLHHLNNAIYRFIFDQREIDIIMIGYAKTLYSEMYESYHQISVTLKGILAMKNKEDELSIKRLDLVTVSSLEFEKYIDFLNEILPGIGYCGYAQITDMYIDAMLISQNLDNKGAQQMYNAVRDMVLSILNHPVSNIRIMTLESIVISLDFLVFNLII